MKLEEIKQIKDDKQRAMAAALCPELPEDIRCWFALLAYAIGLAEMGQLPYVTKETGGKM